MCINLNLSTPLGLWHEATNLSHLFSKVSPAYQSIHYYEQGIGGLIARSNQANFTITKISQESLSEASRHGLDGQAYEWTKLESDHKVICT